jgi:transcriptional/translational regulatory protein YebC/TACO1
VTAIESAKRVGLPKHALDKALDTSMKDHQTYLFDIYGFAGVHFLSEVQTDKKEHSRTNLKRIFAKLGGQAGKTGSVSFHYKHIGRLCLRDDGTDATREETLLETALGAGAEDFERHQSDGERGAYFEVTTGFEAYARCHKAVRDIGLAHLFDHENSGLNWETELTVNCSDLEEEEHDQNMKLLTALQEMEDCTQVWHNMQFEVSPKNSI